jgi:hypothetical protein
MLQKLSAAYVFLGAARTRRDVLGDISLGRIGLHISRYLAVHGGGDRERAVRTAAREAARLLGAGPTRAWTPAERQAWERWSPLVMSLPGVDRWPAEDRRALVEVMRAKGGRRESDYVVRFDAHRRLRAAILQLAASAPPAR